MGRIGAEEVSEQRWKSPSDGVNNLETLAVSNGEVLALETRYLTGPFDRGRLRVWAAMMRSGLRTESRLWTVGGHGGSAFVTSHLDRPAEAGRWTMKGHNAQRSTVRGPASSRLIPALAS